MNSIFFFQTKIIYSNKKKNATKRLYISEGKTSWKVHVKFFRGGTQFENEREKTIQPMTDQRGLQTPVL